MAYTKEGTDGQILRSSKCIVIVIMIFEKMDCDCNYDF